MSDPLEMARCAEINLENLFSAAPFLKSHPIGVLLKMQISECVAGLEAAEHRVHPTDLRVRKRRSVIGAKRRGEGSCHKCWKERIYGCGIL